MITVSIVSIVAPPSTVVAGRAIFGDRENEAEAPTATRLITPRRLTGRLSEQAVLTMLTVVTQKLSV
jgi:hypothetical protein